MAANPTPIRLLLQEVSVEFKGDLKKLWAQEQMPIAKARGKMDVTGKAKIVNFDPDPINQLFFGQTSAVGIIIPVDRELHTISSANTVTVTNTSGFDQDNGVSYASGAAAGAPLLKVTSNVQAGQYSQTGGTYTFAAVDNGLSVAVSYTYGDNTRGKTITITNELMGYAPEFIADVWSKFRNKILGIRLNSCVLGSWTFPSKLEDFWISDITFDASTDASDNLGKIFADTF